MVQLWDSKLAKMGRELNIGSVLRRISEKADVSSMNRGFEDANSRVDQVEQTFLKIIDEMEQINQQTQINAQHINEIASYQREVSIGKRNVNCLSCSPEKTLDQQMTSKYNTHDFIDNQKRSKITINEKNSILDQFKESNKNTTNDVSTRVLTS